MHSWSIPELSGILQEFFGNTAHLCSACAPIRRAIARQAGIPLHYRRRLKATVNLRGHILRWTVCRSGTRATHWEETWTDRHAPSLRPTLLCRVPRQTWYCIPSIPFTDLLLRLACKWGRAVEVLTTATTVCFDAASPDSKTDSTCDGCLWER